MGFECYRNCHCFHHWGFLWWVALPWYSYIPHTAIFLCVSVSKSRTAGADTLDHDGHIAYINMTYGDDTHLSLWWRKQWHFLKHWHIAGTTDKADWHKSIALGDHESLKSYTMIYIWTSVQLWRVIYISRHSILVMYPRFHMCKGLKYHINQSQQWHNPLR